MRRPVIRGNGVARIAGILKETDDGLPVALVYDGDIEAIGGDLMRGALDTFALWWVKVWAIGLVLVFLVGLAAYWLPVDDSDSSRAVRSGLRSHTDALSGCQYLESSGGHLTPRLGANGQPICVGRLR